MDASTIVVRSVAGLCALSSDHTLSKQISDSDIE